MARGRCLTCAPWSVAKSRPTEATDTEPFLIRIRTMLFLSRKVTVRPAPCCAHPSGYLIEYRAPVFRNTRKTWLSGMSPVDADPASPWSGPGPCEVGVGGGGGATWAVVVGGGG